MLNKWWVMVLFVISRGAFSVPKKKTLLRARAPSLGVCSFLYLSFLWGVTELLCHGSVNDNSMTSDSLSPRKKQD